MRCFKYFQSWCCQDFSFWEKTAVIKAWVEGSSKASVYPNKSPAAQRSWITRQTTCERKKISFEFHLNESNPSGACRLWTRQQQLRDSSFSKQFLELFMFIDGLSPWAVSNALSAKLTRDYANSTLKLLHSPATRAACKVAKAVSLQPHGRVCLSWMFILAAFALYSLLTSESIM